MNHIKLGDVADVKISGVDKKTQPGEETVRLCNYTDIYYNWAITKEMYGGLMVASAKANEINDFSIYKGMVVITKDSETREDIGHSAYVADDFCDVVLGYHCAFVRPHKGELDGSFLNGLLRSSYASKYFANNAGGSGQRYYLNEDAIKGLPLFLPSFTEQCLIGKLLSNIDRKIALNRKKIDKLEALAKSIYDYWFVQFDFPDANGRPYKSSGGKMVWNEQLKREVPDGWNACHIGDLCNCHDSLRVPLSGKQRAEMQGGVPYYGATGIMDYVNGHIFDGEFLLLAEDGTVMTEEGFPILQIINGKTWVNNHAHVLSPRIECSVKFLQLHFRNIPVRKIKTGSIQPKITKNNLFAFRVLLIPTLILEQADKFFSFLQKRIETSVKSNERLLWLRAFLLPLLMNGQVEVGE